MKKATLYISGDVQRAGYRTKVVSIAKAYDIKGNVQNLPDGRVKIIGEGEESNLEQFIQAVNIKNTLIKVKDIEKQYSDPSGEYQSFYKLVDEGETDERLDTAADLLKELIHVTKNGFDRFEVKQDVMIEKQDVIIEKQDVMIEKQDVMIEKQDVMIEKQDVMIEKQDVMIDKMDHNTSILKDFKKETNQNFNQLSNIMTKHDIEARERIATITTEISDIKERLSRLESAKV
jgi:acylphosphatase